MCLNPLFMERLVASQLPDAGRVPALYAYLVGDPTRVDVGVNWDARRYAERVPESVTAPGGPLGHAWRAARASGAIDMGTGDADVVNVPWPSVQAAAIQAVTTHRHADDLPRLASDLVFVCRLADDEGNPARPLTEAVSVATQRRTDLVIGIEGTSAESWTAAALMGLWLESVHVVPDDNELLDIVASTASASASASASAPATLLVRGPHAEIDADDLLALAASGTEGPVAPLWVAWDGTIASAGLAVRKGRSFHLFAGHPVEDAQHWGPVINAAGVAGDTFARPIATTSAGSARTRVDLIVRAPRTEALGGPSETLDTDISDLLAPLHLDVACWTHSGPHFVRAAGAVTLSDGTRVPSLRWAIKIAAPPGKPGEAWGDTHFARGLAGALRRLGQEVVIDAYAARNRSTSYLDDVTLALRGPEKLYAPPRGTSVMWIISHPDEVSAQELDGYDAVFAASAPWATAASARLGRPIRPLLQCTDATRFHPSGRPRGKRLIFVGTARGIVRPSVVEPLRAGIPVDVYGPDWRGYIPASAIVADGVANAALPQLYESAHAVLNDHWPAMQREGFVSNRLFDVIACGGRAVSDRVEGIPELFEGAVLTYDSVPELIALLSSDLDARFPAEDGLQRIAARVRREHSFDARARVLLDTVVGARQ